MWGYGLDNGTCVPTVPGPRLTVPSGDTGLTVSLRNTLSQPVSIMIPGLGSSETPEFFIDAKGRRRAKSMVHETAPGTTSAYSFNVAPGTYLYQSGTHPAVQVQMGLYGPATSDVAAGQAYTGVPYDNEIVLLYSEIDADMHDAIAGAPSDNPATPVDETVPTYGTASGPGSTINYRPRYFLVNGDPFTNGAADISAGGAGDRNLVRFLNAGLQNHSPVVVGEHLSLVAEYGKPYRYARKQYSLLLSAGQTRDALFTASNNGRFALFDRQLNLTNNAQAGDGGLMSILAVGGTTPAEPPVAVDDVVSTPEDTPVVVNVDTNDTDNTGIDPNSVAIISQAANGTASPAGGNAVSYVPAPDYFGSDSFTYTIQDVDGNVSNVATVSIEVTPVNDAPVATADAYSTAADTALNVGAPGVLLNDSDVEGDALTASVTTNPAQGSVSMQSNGSFVYTPNPGASGSDSFGYVASDGLLSSTEALVTISIDAPPTNQAPVANDDYTSVTRNTGATSNVANVNVLANDSDPDGTLVPSSVTVTASPADGTAVANADGSIDYRPRNGFTGQDAFSYTVMDNDGQVSNTATVRIDVIRP